MILFNGATGGLGRYLASPIRRRGEESHVLVSRLEDRSALVSELSTLKPTDPVTFIHLAARVSVPACEADPAGTRRINVSLARSTSEAIIRWAHGLGIDLKLIYVSTGHVYAAPSVGAKLAEDDPTSPRSVYAHTKLEAEGLLSRLCAENGVPFLAARVFGLLAPRQAPQYVLPGLIQRVKTRDLAGVPGLGFARDYLDARDVCEDLLVLASAGWPAQSNVVNVCSGVPVTVGDLLHLVINILEPENADTIAQEVREAPGRPDDVPWLVGDPSRFIRLTGTGPRRIPLARSVADAVAEGMSGA